MKDDAPDFWAFAAARLPALLAYAHVLTANRHDAEELVQEALSRVGAAWPRVAKGGNAEAYVRRTMINAHVSGWRSRRREDLVATVPEAQQDESLEQVAAILAVRTALRQLSPRQRAAVVLRYYDGLSVEEAAQALNCSTGTIKSQTHDALSRLAPLLRDDSPPATQAGATQ